MSSSFKPQYGWSIVAYLPLTPRVGDIALKYQISADMVSLLSLLVFWAGLLVFAAAPDSASFRLIAVLCFAAGTLLDVVDGYVARKSGSAGPRGAIVDAAIDLIRYNSLFAFVALTEERLWVSAAIVAYAAFVSIALVNTIRSALSGQVKRKAANEALGRILPAAYVAFCLRNRLLFNPLNLEDQLNVAVLTVGVLFGCVAEAILLCLVVRLGEAALGKLLPSGQ